MRILHVDPERHWGGGEAQVLGLVRHLSAAGHEVVVAAHPDGRLASAATAAGIAVRPLSIRSAVDVAAARGLSRLARGADVVHFHTSRAHAMALFLSTRGVRRVVTRRMDYPPRPGPYVRALYNRCVDGVVAISERIRAVLVAAGVEARRISVIPSGVDLERFVGLDPLREETRAELWGVGGADVVVLAVGALVPRKGHSVLLEAARRLVQRGVEGRYVICGDGEERRSLEQRAAHLGLSSTVRFMGWRDDVPRVLAAADVVVLPSLHEGLGVAALEAMAAARPVIASRTGGLAEVVCPGRTGWLVEPGDASGLADALAAAIDDPDLRRCLGRAGQERVASEFSMARMARRNEELYHALVGA
jgi:glycosyltransferase involved in cell wall biosynthesis